ncbi:MAG: DNA polymerase III subunit delta' [Coriobacteriia bacterium]|nr:DNA polymerase III subunit delta' [Coriobacteriia bacterium]
MTKRGCVWDDLAGQRRASELLSAEVRAGTVSHAYLFVGPPGAGKKTAAKALACSLFCGDGGCGACPACRRVRAGFHPDFRVIRPEGAATYVIEQVREVIHDVALKPVQASWKVYVFEAADAFNEGSANAFLKTLEEPPADVVIVLLAHDHRAVSPTIVSRCQVVRFERLPPSVAERMVAEKAGVELDRAREALAAAGGVAPRAIELLRSPAKREARERLLAVLKELPVMDAHDVLCSARELLTAVKAPLDELKAFQAEELAERREFVGRGGTKPLEERHKRELTAKEREGVLELLNVTESWLRDCLAISAGAGELAVNRDVRDAADEVAAALAPGTAVRAISEVAEARRRLAYNVNPQLAVEAMLFGVREVLACPR